MSSRVLVVEDNALNRELVRDLLEYAGHQVAEAPSVDEGRKHLASSAFDLILLDIQMAGGGGSALLREIRASEAHRRVPVVAVTAQAMEGDRERFLAEGFDGYLSKPIDTKLFAAELEKIKRMKRGTDGR